MSSTLHTTAIRGRREALGLTQKTAAELAGVSEPTWQRFETGGKPIAPYLASWCMKLLNGEIEIPKSTPRKRRARLRKEPTAIRVLRDGWGITQATAADLANVPTVMWQKFEAGEEVPPAYATRCMRLVSGEIPIPASAPRKRTPKEAAALIRNPHRYTREEARAAGRKGGEAVASRPGHMANLGRKGGTQRRRREQG